ncbi:inverse autotransporter beta domain-containing protein [Alphaproteobacteria bacterium]|nr:inverse autotransporter beta domain-containing protein [Alphaproteobacteria bacterium]
MKVVTGLLFCSVALTGCAVLEGTANFFTGPDKSAEAAEAKLAKTVSSAAGSADPEGTVQAQLVNEASKQVAENAARAIDSNIENSKTSISITGADKGSSRIELKNVTGLSYGTTDHSQSFFQGGLTSSDSRKVVNLGLGYRKLSDDEMFFQGVNAFYDYDFDIGHQRTSIGVELRSSALELNANKYMALTDWKTNNGTRERALDGYDIEVGGQLPYIPSGKLYVKTWKWDVPDSSSDVKGKTYSVAFSHIIGPGISVEMGTKDYEGSRKDENFMKLTYAVKMGNGPTESNGPFFSEQMFERKSMRRHLLDEVRRNNQIVVLKEFSASSGGV